MYSASSLETLSTFGTMSSGGSPLTTATFQSLLLISLLPHHQKHRIRMTASHAITEAQEWRQTYLNCPCLWKILRRYVCLDENHWFTLSFLTSLSRFFFFSSPPFPSSLLSSSSHLFLSHFPPHCLTPSVNSLHVK